MYHAVVPDAQVRHGWRLVTLFVRPDGTMRQEIGAREQPRDLTMAEAVSALEDMADRVFRQVHRFRIAEKAAKADAGRIVLEADREQKEISRLEEERRLVGERERDARTSAASKTSSPADRTRYEAMADIYVADGEKLDEEIKRLAEAVAEKERRYNELLNTARKCVLAAEAAEVDLYL